jgi:hypothetical protein
MNALIHCSGAADTKNSYTATKTKLFAAAKTTEEDADATTVS